MEDSYSAFEEEKYISGVVDVLKPIGDSIFSLARQNKRNPVAVKQLCSRKELEILKYLSI
jgi:hypothetical protein